MIDTIVEIYFNREKDLNRNLIIKLLTVISEKITSVVERYSYNYLTKVGLWDSNRYDYLLQKQQ